MKKYLLLIVIITAISACKKSNVLVPGLVGKWELRHAYGGFSYHDSTYAAGNGNMYQFNRDSTYKRYLNGALSASGVFHIRRGNDYQMQSINTILFDNNTYGDPIVVSGAKLTIGTSVADGTTFEYVKIN